jgi:hypothetical protein
MCDDFMDDMDDMDDYFCDSGNDFEEDSTDDAHEDCHGDSKNIACDSPLDIPDQATDTDLLDIKTAITLGTLAGVAYDYSMDETKVNKNFVIKRVNKR